MGKPIPPELRQQYANAVKGEAVKQTAAERARQLIKDENEPLLIKLAKDLPGPRLVNEQIKKFKVRRDLKNIANAQKQVDVLTETPAGES